MIKDILVAVFNDGSSDGTARLAQSMAERFDSHLTALACAFYPVYPTTTVMDMAGVGFIDEEISANKAAAAEALAQFSKGALGNVRQSGTIVLEGFVADCSKQFGEIARRFDLAIIGQAKTDEMRQTQLIEALLFESGRPALVVPFVNKGGLSLDHIAICWDGSKNAARAVGDAMPLLVRAKKITILTVSTEKPKSRELPAADIAQHLARHGLPVELVPVYVENTDVAQVVLSYAADRNITLFVMGAYGHSRIREFVLGGMTRSMLESMTIPVFMSH